MKRTYTAKEKDIERKWFLIDARGKVLGRLAVEVARILRGKDKPIYTPHIDTGDYVVIINARYVVTTGKKEKDKIYRWYSGYPSGLKERTLEEFLQRQPTEVLKRAIRGMLPHNRLGRKIMRKVKIYAEERHPHSAQRPELKEV